MSLRAGPPPSAAKSSLQLVTSEHPQTEDPPVKEPGGAHTSQGCVGGGQRPPSELGIVFRLASMPVLRSNCGISAGSHRKGGSRDSHRWPRIVIPARQVRCSSGRATPTHVFGWGEPSNPSCSAVNLRLCCGAFLCDGKAG